MASAAMAGVSAAVMPSSGRASYRGGKRAVVQMMSSFEGLTARNEVMSLGLVKTSEHHFSLLKRSCAASRGRGGAASSTCNVASEVFRVIPIICALVLIGVAVGFVLLRIEAALEESEK